MYVKRHAVRRGSKRYVYLRLVEAYRDEAGQVRQRVIQTLGREDELKASGQLDQLAASFARLDPPPTGTRRDIGALLLVRHYLQRLGLVEIVDQAAPMRGRAHLTHGEVIAALVANRLSAPSPLYDVAGWASSAAMAELFATPAGLLNDDRLGRALEALAPVAEPVRAALCLAAIERFDGVDASRLHLDVTTVRFAGAYEHSALVAKGWGADRRVARQVRALQAATPSGVPLYFRPHAGAIAELNVLGDTLTQLQQLLPPGLVVVADSALGHVGNLCAAHRAGVGFVVPLRADTGWAEQFVRDVGHLDRLHTLDYTSQREQRLSPDKRTRWRGLLRAFPVTDPVTQAPHDLRVAYIWSSEQAASVADARERALTKAEDTLARIRRGLGGRYYKTQKQVEAKVATTVRGSTAALLTVHTGTRHGKPTLSWQRNADALAAAARFDGLYALATNLPDPLTATDVLRTYKDQWIVERRHRDLKQTLRVRPVFLHNDDRIEALVAVVGIALLVFGLLEADVRRRLPPHSSLPGLLPEDRAAKPTGRNILSAFQGLGLTYSPHGLILDRLSPTQRRILAILDISLPWPEQQIPATVGLNP
ncbi:MAG: IS1634 family transposase [Longimicrobiales bacterium]